MLKLYDRVKIIKSGIFGAIVLVEESKDTIEYLIEKDDKFKTGNCAEDLIWCSWDEVEKL